jgi:hypothetical protein
MMTAMALLNDSTSFVLIRFIGSDRIPLPPFLCQFPIGFFASILRPKN